MRAGPHLPSGRHRHPRRALRRESRPGLQRRAARHKARLPCGADEDERDHHAGNHGDLSPQLLALAVLTRGRTRVVSAAAGILTAASFLITRFGNVPINGRIKQWAATAPPADHAGILRRWELFNDARTVTAVVAFALLAFLALRETPPRSLTENPL
ncbi:DUF1772 domain-containing protein [Streptomyces sp. CB00455]|uniref:DUF1772 domain-containing protein n=1 Tax=Streptomyces sp. CB00455 TaxID=1703927 RepID=UPI00093A4F2A|nr:DUF1772 domain-containing protein [Streptomyces sp. CB00455]